MATHCYITIQRCKARDVLALDKCSKSSEILTIFPDFPDLGGESWHVASSKSLDQWEIYREVQKPSDEVLIPTSPVSSVKTSPIVNTPEASVNLDR